MLRGPHFYGGDYLLKHIIHKQDYDAGEDHDHADDAVQGDGAGAVCDGGGAHARKACADARARQKTAPVHFYTEAARP